MKVTFFNLFFARGGYSRPLIIVYSTSCAQENRSDTTSAFKAVSLNFWEMLGEEETLLKGGTCFERVDTFSTVKWPLVQHTHRN